MRLGSMGARGGFGSSGVLGRAGYNPGPLVTATDTGYFAASGCTFPIYGTASTPPFLYVASTNTYWFTWQSNTLHSDGTTIVRRVLCRTFNATSRVWSSPYYVVTDTLVDDDHGVPAIERDNNGYVHVFYGAHGGNPILCAHTTNPDDPSDWTLDANIGFNSTYPKPTFISSSLWCFARTTNGSDMPYTYVNTTAITSGAPTWTAPITVIDFGPNSRIYAGNHVVRNTTELHFCWTRADGNDTFRQSVYYGIYDTATRTFMNYARTVTVTEAQMPVPFASGDANFRIVDQQTSNTFGNVPNLDFDANGHPHVLYMDGPGLPTGPYNFMHMWHNGTSWQTADTVGSFATNSDTHRRDTFACIPLPDGSVDLYWITDSGQAYTRGGNVSKRNWKNGVLGPQILVQACGTTYAYDGLTIIRNAETLASGADARVGWCEITQDSITESGKLRVFALGDNGYPRCPFEAETQTLVATIGTQTDGDKDAINELIGGLKGIGVWSKIDVYYNFKAASKTAQYTNWKTPASFALSDVGGGPTSVLNSYLQGNGTSTKVTTGFIPSTNATQATLNSTRISVQVLDNQASDTFFDAGATGTGTTQIDSKGAGGAIRGAVNSGTNTNYNLFSTSTGISAITRSSSTAHTAYRDGNAAGTASVASTALPTNALNIGGNSAGTSFSPRQIRSVMYGAGGLSATAEFRTMIWEFRYNAAHQ